MFHFGWPLKLAKRNAGTKIHSPAVVKMAGPCAAACNGSIGDLNLCVNLNLDLLVHVYNFHSVHKTSI